MFNNILRRTGAGLLVIALLLSASACAAKNEEVTSATQIESVQTEEITQAGETTQTEQSDEAEVEGFYTRGLAKRSQNFSPEDAVISALSEDFPRAEKNYTVMVYMIGSNLESRLGNATKDMEEMEASGLSYTDTNLLLYTGGARRWVGAVPADRNSIIDMSVQGEDRIVAQTDGNSDMGAAETLSSFVNFCTANYPAQHYALILWDHGGGSLWGYGADELYDSDSLLLPEMDAAMAETIFASDTKLDFVGFDACLMATIENMAIWADYASYMVASEELEPGDGWDYSFLELLNSTSDPVQITDGIVNYFRGYYEAAKTAYSNPDITLSAVDLDSITALYDAVDGLAAMMEEELDNGGYSQLMQLRGQAKSFGLSQNEMGSVSYYYDMVDIGDLAFAVSEIFPDVAEAVSEALGSAVVSQAANITGTGGISMYYPYKNKIQYKELADTYSSLCKSDNYRSFLSANASEWLSGRSRDWKLGDPVDKGDEYILALTEDQLANMTGASYTIVQETSNGYRCFARKVSLIPDEDGNLHLPKDIPLISMTSDLGDSFLMPVIEVESDDDRIIYNSINVRLISESAKLLVPDHEYEEVCITLEYDRKDDSLQIQKITTSSGESDLSGKKTVDIEHWEGVEYLYYPVRQTKDADGTSRPFSEWEKTGFVGWNTTSVDSSVGFRTVYTGDLRLQRYAQIELEDTNGEVYATGLVKLEADTSEKAVTSKTDKGELTYLVYEDHVIVSEYQGEDTDIIIPETVEGKPVTGIDDNTFGKMIIGDSHGTYPVVNVTLPDTIEYIGNNAFLCCRRLEKLNIPKNVKDIGNNAFYYCISLKEAELPEGLEKIGKTAFAYCQSLKEINIPKSVEYLGDGALMGCSSLEAINLSPENVNYLSDSGALYSADGKDMLAWPAASAEQAIIREGTERIGYGGFMDAVLTEVNLPDSLKIIDNYAFYNCKQLAVPYFPEGLEEIGMYAFDYSLSADPEENVFDVRYINIGSAVSYIGKGAFQGYMNKVFAVAQDNRYFSSKDGILMNKAGDALLEGSFNSRNQFILPEGTLEFSFDMLDIFDNYFNSDMSMTKHIYIPGSVTRMPENDNYVTVEDLVFHCEPGSAAEKFALKYGFDISYDTDPNYEETVVETEAGEMTFRIRADNAALVSYQGNDTVLDIPSEVDGRPVKTIGNGETAISRNSYNLIYDDEPHNDSPELKKIIIPEGVEEISSNSLSDFNSSIKDLEIDLPSTLKIIGDNGIRTPGTVTLPAGLQRLGKSFLNGTLAEIFTVTPDIEYIDPQAFISCKGITAFMQEGENGLYQVRDGVIFSKDGKKLLFYPGEGPETFRIPDGCETIGEYAFYENKSLKTAVIPDSVVIINERAFSRCSNLTEVVFPTDSAGIIIGEAAFSYCSQMTDISLDSVQEIGSNAFRHCEQLKNVSLKEGLTIIGPYAFSDTPYADIKLPDSLRIIGHDAFSYYKGAWENSADVIRIGPNVSEIGYSAFASIGATKYEVDPDNQYFESGDGFLMTRGGASVISCPSGLQGEVFIPDGTMEIADWAFRYAPDVTKVHIPESVVVIGSVNFEENYEHDDEGNLKSEYYVTICCKQGSYAYRFAQEYGIPIELE